MYVHKFKSNKNGTIFTHIFFVESIIIHTFAAKYNSLYIREIDFYLIIIEGVDSIFVNVVKNDITRKANNHGLFAFLVIWLVIIFVSFSQESQRGVFLWLP